MAPDNLDPNEAAQNPYAAPHVFEGEANLIDAGHISFPTRGMVGHAVAIGVLMIVQGVLDFLAGVAAAFYAFFMPGILAQAQQQAAQGGGQPSPPMPEHMGMIFAVGGGIVAIVMVALGLLTIYCGISVMKFQNRILTMVALSGGLITLFTCYCFPTSLILGAYGLIFLLNQPVTSAYAMRSEGRTVDEIRQVFHSLPR